MEAQKHAAQKRLKRAQDNVARLASFDETDEASQAKILDLIKNPKLQELSQKEHAALKMGQPGAPRIRGEQTESKLVGYKPEDIKMLNEAFNGNNSTQLKTHEMPIISGNRDTGRRKDVILWSRARFAFERAIGNGDTPLYQHRYATYVNYVALNQQMIMVSQSEIINLEALLNVSVKKMSASEHFIDTAREHFHSKIDANSAIKMSELINRYIYGVSQMADEVMNEMKKDMQFKEEIRTIEAELARLSEQPAPKSVGGEAKSFDPEYVYNLHRTDKGKFEAGNQRQSANLPPNAWNISSDPSKFNDPIAGENKTWKLGYSLYEKMDPPSAKTQQDVRTLLTYRNDDTKITQPVQIGPYAKDEVLEELQSKLEKLPTRGWDEELKRKVAAGANTHWALLWNLGKQNITKDDFLKLLGKNEQEYVTLANGTKESLKNIFRQWPSVNSKTVRDQVIANDNTPDWVLMYMAQFESDVQIVAKGRLAKRGWKVKENENREPILDSDGNWIWIKTKGATASMSLSFREAQLVNPAVPPAGTVNPLELIEDQKNLQPTPPPAVPTVPAVNNAPVGAPDKSSPANPKEQRPELAKQKAFEDGLIPQTIKPVPLAEAVQQTPASGPTPTASVENKPRLSWRG